MKQLLNVTSLLVSTALLLVGHGMQLTLLPLRASDNGISEFLIGISGSSYFFGFIAGCLIVPKLIARAGHIRCFSVLAAAMVCSILMLELMDGPAPLLILRFLTGVSICGLYSVIESWLNSQTTPQTRGQVLAIYTFIVLSAMTVGQLLINVGPINSATPFMVTAIFIALAIIPIGITRRMAPPPPESAHVSFKLLYQRSRSAFSVGVLSGLVVGSFWSLGAVFASQQSTVPEDITWFMTAAIGGGAVMQYPIGWLSDKIDRRYVLIGLSIAGAVSATAVALSTDQPWHLVTVFMYGATCMPLYAIALATAADVSSSEEFVTIGTTILLLNALAAALSAIVFGQLMGTFGSTALFWSFAVVCVIFTVYLLWQLRTPRLVSVMEQTPFELAASESAPGSFDLDPRATEEPDVDLESHPTAAENTSYRLDNTKDVKWSQP